MSELVLLSIAIGVLAFLNSSIGHGGASGYLAAMAIAGLAPEYLRPAALSLNLFVSAFAFVQFSRKWKLKFKLLSFLLITSIPASYIGGNIAIKPGVFKYILGVFLILASLKMFFRPTEKSGSLEPSIWLAMTLGGVLGFFSGLIGIGGGIILSPIILLLGWTNVKETAIISAGFIWVNSAFALLGIYNAGDFVLHEGLSYWIPAAILGGLIGSYLGSFKFRHAQVKALLVLVLISASIKLLLF